MRMRATRISLALALTAVLAAAGAVGPVAGLRAAIRDMSRPAVATAHAAAAAGLSGPHGVISAHPRAPAVDAALVPAALLTVPLLAWVALRRRPVRGLVVSARAHARAPPARWQ